MNTYIHEIILKLDVEIKDTPQSSFKSQNSKISTTKSVESHASILNSERQKFMKKFSFVDEETKSLYWNKALKLLKNKTAKRDFSRKNEPTLNASILNNSRNTFEREKIELQNWKEKYTSCEVKMQTMKKQYEAMLQEKCKKIQELEIENKLLKKRCEKPAKSALPHEEGCSPLMDVINQNQKRRITKSEYLNSYNPEKELKKLKEDYNKLYQEKQVLKTEYEVYKSNKENETILISQNAERQASDNNIKYILKTQIEENKKFRHMLGNLIDSKNKKALLEDIKADHDRQSFKEFELKIKEILNSNSILDQQKSIELEKRLDELHSKCKYKVYYKLFKHCQSLQCKLCSEHFRKDEFITHVQKCSYERAHHSLNRSLPEMKFSITQTLIKEEENSKKPFTEYVILVKSDGNKWVFNRRYKHFCELHASLVKNHSKVEFPKSASIFSNKTLNDIRKNSVVDGRRKLLQNYINDIAAIPEIRNSTKFNNFLGVLTKQVDKDDLILPTASIDDIFDKVSSYKDHQSSKAALNNINMSAHMPSSSSKEVLNPYTSDAFHFNKLKEKSDECNRSQQRRTIDRDKLTLMDSFNEPGRVSKILYSQKNQSNYSEHIHPFEKPENSDICNFQSTRNEKESRATILKYIKSITPSSIK